MRRIQTAAIRGVNLRGRRAREPLLRDYLAFRPESLGQSGASLT